MAPGIRGNRIIIQKMHTHGVKCPKKTWSNYISILPNLWRNQPTHRHCLPQPPQQSRYWHHLSSQISHFAHQYEIKMESYQQSLRAILHSNRTSYSTFLMLQFQQSRYVGWYPKQGSKPPLKKQSNQGGNKVGGNSWCPGRRWWHGQHWQSGEWSMWIIR